MSTKYNSSTLVIHLQRRENGIQTAGEKAELEREYVNEDFNVFVNIKFSEIHNVICRQLHCMLYNPHLENKLEMKLGHRAAH